MLSYAQNAEDVVLARVFSDRTDGFYLDVGAFVPDHGSVTKHFYDRGWHGVNVEPARDAYRRLCQARPRDINLNICISDHAGVATFYESVEPERSTLSAAVAEVAAHLRFAARKVVVRPLADVCAEYAPDHIDFLKIDVEGHEAEVIAGADWTRWRPVVLVVEATEPGRAVPSQERWEPMLLAADYELALFDGLNRFYVRREDRALLPLLAVPANAHDDFVPHRHHAVVEELKTTRHELRQLREELRRRDRRIRRLEARLAPSLFGDVSGGG
ncbi:MAG TPA: FkbM family methyltransferase [Candidatus Dormibacteraeota bacterium]|nr:FkbM family methyltransferase [Candidatus Dormibacteraeota bacterium]